MAEDKKEDKPKRKSSALYDHPTSKKRGEESEPAPKKEDAEKAPDKDASEESAEDKGLKTALSGTDKLIEGLKALNKAHETERRDFHGNHREALRQMASRHEKGIKDLMTSHADGMGGEAPAVDAAEGAAAPAEGESA